MGVEHVGGHPQEAVGEEDPTHRVAGTPGGDQGTHHRKAQEGSGAKEAAMLRLTSQLSGTGAARASAYRVAFAMSRATETPASDHASQ